MGVPGSTGGALPRAVLSLIAALAVFVPAEDAVSKGGMDLPPSRDLITRDMRPYGRGDWSSWWSVNRANLVPPVYRASHAAAAMQPKGKPPAPDAAARERARQALLAELKNKEEIVASEAALALGRAGDARDIELLAKIVADERPSNDGRLRTLAAFGLAYMPAGDAAQSAAARAALLKAVEEARGGEAYHLYLWAGSAYVLAMRKEVSVLPRLLELETAARSTDDRAGMDSQVLGAVDYAIAALGGAVHLERFDKALHGKRPPNSGNKEGAWSLCHAATRMGGASAAFLRDAARDEREVVRRAALGALGAAGADEDSVKLLRHAMFNDKDNGCRQAAVIALARTAHSSAVEMIVKGLEARSLNPEIKGDDAIHDRCALVLGLGLRTRAQPDAKSTEILVRAIRTSNHQTVRAALAIACAIAGAEDARPLVAEFVGDDRDGLLGPSAAWSLGLMKCGDAEKKVLHDAVAQSVFSNLRCEAALALGRLGDHSVVDQLREIVNAKKTKDLDRATAAVCLGCVGDDADVDVLVAAIVASGNDGQLRACLVHGLGRLLDQSKNAAPAALVADSMWFYDSREPTPDVIHEIQRLAE